VTRRRPPRRRRDRRAAQEKRILTDEATTGLEARLLDATAETALAALDEAGPRADDLVQAWVKQGNAAAVAETAETGSGPLRKAARRGLNVLKSRGISVPTRTKVAQIGATTADVVEEAWMLAPDTSGTSLFAFSRQAAASRCRAAFVILNDVYGVQRVDNDELSHSKLQERLDRAITNRAYKPIKVPLGWARWRVGEALKRQIERGIPEPLGLTTARDLLNPSPSEAPTHPLDEEGLVLDDDDARELAKTSGKLHQLPEFQGWFPTKVAVDEMMLKVGETMKPGEKPPEGHVEAQLEAQVQAATDRYFTPEARERLLRLMKDSAVSVLLRAGEQNALEVVATMKAIEQCGLITDPPHEVPFLRAFFDKAVAFMVAQGQGSLKIPVPNRLPTDGASGSPETASTTTSDAPADSDSSG
jgi:hypothetical protein